ncbi:hypothetical protein DFH28DRAFT_883785, partial [Melampsora americana]
LTIQPRRWRKTLSSAIDAFRYMLKKEKQLTTCALSLSAMDVLGMNCPRCFGPLQKNDIPDECDYHVCTDGNFQHRRHLAASREYEEQEIETPPLFLDPKKIDEWEKRVRNQGRDNELDRCSVSHTAAGDVRGRSTWKGCDETGLIGLACRHDHVLKFLNVIQSGER